MLRTLLSFPALGCLLLVSCERKADTSSEAESTQQATLVCGSTSGPTFSIPRHNEPNPQFANALAAVNAQCPDDYPEAVTPLPESKDFEDIKTAELMAMLESWNPSLREQAAKALSDRGEEVMDVLKQGSQSDNWMIRAGTTTALAAIIKDKLGQATADQQEAIKQTHADIISEFVRLTYDDRLEVRVAALNGLSTVAPQTPEAAKAVLHLCNDPDDYLSQDAMITLDKRFSINALEQSEVITAFKEALKGELPRGKGHIVRIIVQMKPAAQKQFVPDLLDLLDWQPRRDTMFAAGGQENAIKMLTKMREPELVSRLPMLMGKIGRGAGLFDPCLDAAKAFGKDAKPILPELKAILADWEANGKNAKIRPNRDHEASIKRLKDTITYLESL